MTTTLLLAAPHDDPLRVHVEAMVAESADVELLDVVASAVDVMPLLESTTTPVDVLVLHEQLGPVPVLELARDLNRRHPDVSLLLLVEDDDPERLRAAMFAGFRGVVSRSGSLDEFHSTVRNAAEWSSSLRGRVGPTGGAAARGRAGTLVAVAGGKGGVGCTLTAASMALQLAEEGGRSVCLVDLDLQAGDVRSYLSTTHERSIHRLVLVASELNEQVLDDVLFRHRSGLRILLPPLEGELAEDVDAAVSRQVLAALRARFDVVVVDVGSQMTEATAAAVEIADVVAVVTTPDLPALRGTNRLLQMCDRLAIRSKDVVVVANRVSRDSEIQPDVLARIVAAPVVPQHLRACFRDVEASVNAGSLDTDDGPWREMVARLADDLLSRAGGRSRADTGAAGTGAAAAEAGQAAVEFVAVVPLVLVAIMLAVQGAVFGWTQVQVQDAAREGARQLELSPGADADGDGVYDDVAATVLERLPGPVRDGADVRQAGAGVEVSVDVPSVVPFVPSVVRTSGSAGGLP